MTSRNPMSSLTNNSVSARKNLKMGDAVRIDQMHDLAHKPAICSSWTDEDEERTHIKTLEGDCVDLKKTAIARRFDAQHHHQLADGNKWDSYWYRGRGGGGGEGGLGWISHWRQRYWGEIWRDIKKKSFVGRSTETSWNYQITKRLSLQ